jgi:broad specificity phosphatase PhoE
MTRLFLIRHAEPETGWGEADPDPGLSAQGREQAATAALTLEGLGDLAVVSSPMRRCRETADAFLRVRGGTALIVPRVSEVAAPVGVADRRAWLAETFPWRDGMARRSWADVDPALRAWRDAVVAWVRAVERDCAVFSHFIAINALASAALERDETIVCRPGYASITEFALDAGRLRLVKLGAEMDSGAVH